MSQDLPTGLSPGDRVHVRGEGWRIERLVQFTGCTRVDLSGLGARNRGRRRSVLWPFDRPVRTARRVAPRFASRRRWLRACCALAVSGFAHDRLQTPLTARIALYPHQFVPALAIVRGDGLRVLLADEVGLGKTIQAALVCSELRLRGRGDRILILTPAGLRAQWAGELRDRFDLDADVIDAVALGRRVASLPSGLNPWAPPGIAIVSIDFAKHPEVLRPLEGVRWDVLIVDEAHAAAPGSDRAAAIQRLAASARVVVLATATPHNGDDAAFSALCSAGRLEGEPPVLLIRRTRSEIGLARQRRTSVLLVRPTGAEHRMHRILRGYIRDVWREAVRRHDRGALLAMTVLWKRALSSAASLHASVLRRLALLDATPRDAWQASLPLVELDGADEAPSGILGAQGLDDSGRERALLNLVGEAAADAAGAESKIGRLVRLLARIREPAIVFTEYRDTLERLRTPLDGLSAVETIHGGVPASERERACRRFSSGHTRILLATDAASEGLNLQQRCRLVINVELPWNPIRLEQRAGRVDRIDQRRVPHVVHLVARDTAESVVHTRLVQRAGRAASAIGTDPLSLGQCEYETAGRLLHIVTPTFRGRTRPQSRPAARMSTAIATDLPAVAAREAARHHESRSLVRALKPVPCGGLEGRMLTDFLARELAWLDRQAPLATSLRSRRGRILPAGLLAVLRIRIGGFVGIAVADTALPVHLAAPGLRAPTRDGGRTRVHAIAHAHDQELIRAGPPAGTCARS
jgi:superfamily II DNA or RNA helicase